jgi:Flp pilus assembly protein TadD
MARSPLRKASLNTSWLQLPSRAVLAGAIRLVLAGGAVSFAPGVHAARTCEDWRAEIVSVEGDVDVLSLGATVWTPGTRADQLCVGDLVRTGDFGRATVRLRDDSTLRYAADSLVRLGEPKSIGGTLIDLVRGIMHVISRDPRELTFQTPFANAGLEGTEFELRVPDGATSLEVVVVEGQVGVTNATAHVSVPAGNRATAPATGATVIVSGVPLESLRWAGYYPPLLAGPLPAPDAAPSAAQSRDPEFFAARAAARLRYGRLAEAEADLAEADKIAGRNATAQALRSLMAAARADRGVALALAQEARSLAPEAVTPLIALSYAQQARHDLVGATQSIDLALAAEPTNAIALTRRAEIALARDDVHAAVDAATRAAALDPALAGPHTTLGFARLRSLDVDGAMLELEQAVALDPSAPRARLGLGIALIHGGDPIAGRREIELAVPLDPVDPLTRSYMGKTYDAEHRDKLTASQLGLAKDLDPLDATPWLYEALHLLGENEPIAGVRSLDKAARRNDDSAVFRSELLLDEDLAVHANSGVSRLYREVGLGRTGFLRGVQAAAEDPIDHGAHRLLADTYSFEPRQEPARVSELLMAQLTQPLNLTPIQPQLGQPSTFIQSNVGPSDLAFSELGPLFAANGLRFRVSTVAGANGTHGADAALGGAAGRWSYSVAHYDYATDGFRENNDLEQKITNALLQVRLSPATTLQAELRSTETEHGDLALSFDPARYGPTLRVREDAEQLRIGLRHDLTAGNSLFVSSIVQDVAASNTASAAGMTTSLDGGGDGYSVELQDIHRSERWWLQSGLSYVQRDLALVTRLSGPLPFPPFTVVDQVGSVALDLDQTSAYAYAHLRATDKFALIVGASADTVSDYDFDHSSVNPKLGLSWQASDRLTVRAATFETVQGSLATSRDNPQPRLEPVQVAGFTQLLEGAAGDETAFYGAAVDAELSDRLLAGLEVTHRQIDRLPQIQEPEGPPGSGPPTGVTTVQITSHETSYRAHAHRMLTDKLTLGAEYRYDRMSNTPLGMFGYTHMRAERLPLQLRYFGSSGLTANMRASYVQQDGNFVTSNPAEGYVPGEDEFWVVDASIGFRLPNRRGVVSVNVDNLLDEDFRFQDIDPQNPSIMPERMGYVRFTVAFD